MLLISKCSSRGSIDTDEYRDDYDDESTDKSGSGFMNTFRTAVQRAYDAVGDPEKEGVNQDDITDILSKLGYSSEDRETQNILSQAAVMTTKGALELKDLIQRSVNYSNGSLALLTSRHIEAEITRYFPRDSLQYRTIARAWADFYLMNLLLEFDFSMRVIAAQFVDVSGIVGLADAYTNPKCNFRSPIPVTTWNLGKEEREFNTLRDEQMGR